MEDRRVVEKPHLAADGLVEGFDEIGSALGQIPLVRDDDDAAPGAVGFAADRLAERPPEDRVAIRFRGDR